MQLQSESFPKKCYISRESIRLGIKRCNCICNLQKVNSRKQKQLHVIILMTRVRTPPAWQRSQNPPRLKKSKKSLQESLRASLRGFWLTPQNESKTSLLETLRVKNHLFFDSGDSFLTRFWLVGQDPRRLARRLSRRLSFDFLSRGGF